MTRTHNRKGMTLVTCLIFMVVFLALGSSLASLSGTHVQVSANQQRAARALAGAESGLEVLHYWLSQVVIDSTAVAESEYFSEIITQMRDNLYHANATNMKLSLTGALQAVPLDSASGQSFSAQLTLDPNGPVGGLHVLYVTVTGSCQGMQRTIGVDFSVDPYVHPIFKYGLATKGPIVFPNNPTTTTVTSNWEADIYTESSGSAVGVYVGGNTNFDGDIMIADPSATVDFVGAVSIAGDTGQDAIDNHVTLNADPVEFPTADTSVFLPYATTTFDPCAVDMTKGLTLTNTIIPAGTNPTFDGTVNIEGVLIIEQPNIVNFNSNVQLEGMIVGESGTYSASGNQINIGGNFASLPLPSDSQFDDLRAEEGSSIITPDFDVSFTGNYSSIEGIVAAGTLHFSGNASAIIKGSLLSFADAPTVVEGNVSLTFDRANTVQIPAGFDTRRILEYSPTSYAMVF